MANAICIPVEMAKNFERRENLAWDSLNNIVLEAALSVVPGSKVKNGVPKILNDKINAQYVYLHVPE